MRDFCERRRAEDAEIKLTHKEAKYQCEMYDFEINLERELENCIEMKH